MLGKERPAEKNRTQGFPEDIAMLQTFLTVFGQMMIVLALLAAGYILNRFRLIPKEAELVLSRLVTMLFLPALTLNTFLSRCTVENLSQNWTLVLYGGAMVLIVLLCSYPLGKLLSGGDSYLAGIIRYCVTHPNTGGVGTPLVLAMFGTMGLFQLNLFTFLSNVICYSWGISQLLPGDGKKTLKQTIRGLFNPNFLMMLLGGLLGLTGIAAKLPDAVFDGLTRLGTCYPVCSLILTGFVIADYRPKEIFSDKRVYAMTALRLVILPLVILTVFKIFHASETLMLMVCLTVVCPCGMNVVVYPAAYRQDSRFGASLVLISSTLAVVTVPLLYALFCG